MKVRGADFYNPRIDNLVSKVDSPYTLVMLAAKRARQINSYYNSIKRHELVKVRPPQIEITQKDPLLIAFEEIENEKITFERTIDGIK